MNLNGILIVDKPAGWTSHDVVAKLRNMLKQGGAPRKQRVGHGGTLDPMATGVLPVFIGKATRASVFCENAGKEYVAGIKFGVVTDTQDITGTVLRAIDVNISRGELEAVLPRFSGHQKQIPPMYSAIKKDGKKLYELARRGVEIERPAREIEIFELEITDEPAGVDSVIADTSPPGDGLTRNPPQISDSASDCYLRISCSKGTYIRTLCHDIGQALGCGAVLSYLRRTKAGVYTTEDAFTLEEITRNAENATVHNLILPSDSIFAQYPSITLNVSDSGKAKNGMLPVTSQPDGRYRVYAPDGEFLLFGEAEKGRLKLIRSFY